MKILDDTAKKQHDPAMSKTWLLRSENHFSDPRASVVVSRQQRQMPMRSHAHEFVEIVLILSGWGIHSTGDIRHEIRAGDVLVIQGRRSHAYEKTENLQLANVLLRPQILEDIAKNLGSLPGYHPLFTFEFARWRSRDFTGRLHLGSSDLQKASRWIDSIEEESGRGGEGGYCLAQAWLVLLIGLLARSYGKMAEVSSHLDMRLGRVLSRIDQDPCRAYSLEQMTKDAAMSQRSFLRYFKKATGFSPADYLIRGRIRRAGQMLAGNGERLPVTEIAFRCGFTDSNYFSRQFRRVTGKSPREYRSGGGLLPETAD